MGRTWEGHGKDMGKQQGRKTGLGKGEQSAGCGWTDRRTAGGCRADRLTDGLQDGQADGWRAENWTDRWTGGCRTDRWTDRGCRTGRQMDRGLQDGQMDRQGLQDREVDR